MQTSAGAPMPRCPASIPRTRAGSAGRARKRLHERQARFAAPLQGEREQQLEPGRARLGLAERQLLRVVVDRRVVRADRVDRPVGEPRAQALAVALAAERRHDVAVRVEVAEVELREVQVVRAHVAGDRQPLALGHADHLDRLARRQPAEVHAGAGDADELEDRAERDRLGERRDPRQPEPRRDLAVVGDAAFGEMRILRAQPHGEPEGRRVLQRAPQDLRVGERDLGLRERDAAVVAQLGHLGEALALELGGERTDRIDAREVEAGRAPREHLDQPRLVERRIGVGRAGEAGDAAGDRREHLRLERRLVLEARLAQPRREVDQPRRHDEPVASTTRSASNPRGALAMPATRPSAR